MSIKHERIDKDPWTGYTVYIYIPVAVINELT